ncbi:MAG: protein-glutamate O-methyltransferase CheR [Candidatus Omnitrophota bacterium]|jgi:chemotaxis protein methyltransferase CheR
MQDPQEAEYLKDPEFLALLDYIRKQKGIDLSSYRKSFVLRRLRVRMSNLKLERYTDYQGYIQKTPEEFGFLLNTLGVNVTEFFRDKEVFQALRSIVIPEILTRKAQNNNRLIRIWSAACATGEEPYSLAIMLKEELLTRQDFSFRIIATDMDREALDKAAKAEYKDNELKKLDKKTLDKYFIPAYNNVYKLKDEIKGLVKFQQHNLITEPYLQFMDLICCRNIMIYLTRYQQEEFTRKFYDALNAKGYLAVGKVENVWQKDLFSTLEPNNQNKIYQKIG